MSNKKTAGKKKNAGLTAPANRSAKTVEKNQHDSFPIVTPANKNVMPDESAVEAQNNNRSGKDTSDVIIDKKKMSFHRKMHHAFKWFTSDKALIVIALVLSIICWVLVTLNVSLDDTKQLSDIPIRIDTTDLEETFGLQLIDIIDPPALGNAKVDVTLTGSIYQLSRVTTDDVTVSAQVSGVSRSGEYTLSLVASCSVRDVNVSINNGYDFVKVWFDRVQQKDITVDKVIANGVSTEDGLIIGDYVSSIKTLTIEGPESIIETVASVQVRADVNQQISESLETAGTIYYTDADGYDLSTDMTEYITIIDYNDTESSTGAAAGAPQADDISVIVPIRKTAQLPLALTFKNVPDSFNINTLRYTLSPSKISIEGDIDAIDKLSEEGKYYVDGVDLSSLSPNNSRFTLKLNLSTGIEEINGVTDVVVQFDLSTYAARTITIENNGSFALANADNISASITTESLDIVVIGPESVLNALSRSNFAISVDMETYDNTTGQRKMTATATVKGRSDCWVIGTYTVMVLVE